MTLEEQEKAKKTTLAFIKFTYEVVIGAEKQDDLPQFLHHMNLTDSVAEPMTDEDGHEMMSEIFDLWMLNIYIPNTKFITNDES